MKVQIRRLYLAKDGTEFTTAKECEKHEKFQLTKSDLDFLKDVISNFLSNGEANATHIKSEAKFYKESDSFHSHLCYKDLTKIRAKIKKLAEVQRKIKRMR